MKDGIVIASYIFLTIVGLAIIFVMGYGVYEGIQMYDTNKYCKSIGWDGGSQVCYKDIPHSSGIGTERIFSGSVRSQLSEKV